MAPPPCSLDGTTASVYPKWGRTPFFNMAKNGVRPYFLPERAVDARHHLLRHQLHRAAHRNWVGPVVADIEQPAERADALAEREQIIDHFVDRPGDQHLLDEIVVRQRSVVHRRVVLEE